MNDEPNETFILTLSNPGNARLGTPSSTTVTISDDDAPPIVAWQSASFSVGEGAGTGLATAQLSAASGFTVTVTYATSNGTATAGSDYSTTNGTLTFAPGETRKNVSVPILNDATIEPNETVTLTLSSPTNASLGAPNPATLTILDDAENRPTHLSRISGTEDATYDADGERVTRTYRFTATVYLGGIRGEELSSNIW